MGRRSLPRSINDDAEEPVTTSPTLTLEDASRSPTPRALPAEVQSAREAFGSRGWFRTLDSSLAISYAPNPSSKHGRAKSRYAAYRLASTVGVYKRLHATVVAGDPDGAVSADADFCFDFAHGLVRLLDSYSSSTTRIRMGDTRAQADLLSPDDRVPDLVDLVASAPTGRAPLVIDTSSNLKAVSASPQPTNGCTSSGPLVVAGLDVDAVLREPDPPSCL